MAEPHNKLPASANRSATPQPRPGPGGPAGRRGWRFGYFWLILGVILAFWYAGFGWDDSGGWVWGHRNAAVPAAVTNDEGLNGPGVAILEVANKQDYVGQSFEVRNVSVDHWSGSRAVWIGSRHSFLPMLLILPAASPLTPAGGPAATGNGQPAGTVPGAPATVQLLNVTGRIMKAPPSAQAQQQWSLSDDDVNQLEDEGVYIQATAVTKAKH
ncbi:MAG TPA: hypothetical protein VGG72_10295 [Bryobacteraceae bacterium]